MAPLQGITFVVEFVRGQILLKSELFHATVELNVAGDPVRTVVTIDASDANSVIYEVADICFRNAIPRNNGSPASSRINSPKRPVHLSIFDTS